MRLFLALDLTDEIRARIARFIEGVQNFAPDARWAKPESLHVTLKFIGEQPDSAVEQITHALQTNTVPTFELNFRAYGFFPTAKAPRVFWIGIQSGPELPALAVAVDDKVSTLGIPKEIRAFSPHLTLARAPGASGSHHQRQRNTSASAFHRLQEKLAALPTPDFGTMTAREFFLFQSQLSPKGSKYTKLAQFALK
jgi:RNA 2',3'-cyclic 3'-phosphodiesterase